MEERACIKCTASGPRVILEKCPICLKFFCESCALVRGGRNFCSAPCADYFYFEDEDS